MMSYICFLLTFSVNEKLPMHTVSCVLRKKIPNPVIVYFRKIKELLCSDHMFISFFLFFSGGADPSIDDFSLFCNKLMNRRDCSRIFEMWPQEFVSSLQSEQLNAHRSAASLVPAAGSKYFVYWSYLYEPPDCYHFRNQPDQLILLPLRAVWVTTE